MGIIDGYLLLCHGISEQIKDKTVSTRKYNDRTVYDWFNDSFSFDCGSPALNPPHVPIGDSPRLNKTAWYTSDPLTDAISITPGYSVSTLTTPSDPPQLPEQNYDYPDTLHTIMNDNPFRGNMTRGYCSRFHDGIICYKNWDSIDTRVTLTTGFITVTDLSEWFHS